MGLQQVTCIVFRDAMVRSCARLSWYVFCCAVYTSDMVWLLAACCGEEVFTSWRINYTHYAITAHFWKS